MSESRRPALGRGLSALIPGAASARPSGSIGDGTPPLLDVHKIRASARQPRRYFDDKALQDLANSISENGILQPIVVRRVAEDDYVIIAGERRFRAAQLADLMEVPVVIREATDAEAFELALVENIQRQDLNPLEEAEAYQTLVSAYSMKQDQVARRVGKDPSTVSNALRLLRLHAHVRDLIRDGDLSAGHGRAILGVKDGEAQADLADQAVAHGWSVRETERQARAMNDPAPTTAEAPTTGTPSDDALEPVHDAAPDHAPTPDRGLVTDEAIPSADYESRRSPAEAAVEDEIRTLLGAPVRLVQRDGKGRVEIRFHSLDELERLLEMFRQLPD